MYILIDKPSGWTSNDIVVYTRGKYRQIKSQELSLPTTTIKPKKTKIRVGHAGTLDPFATGLLIVGIGRESTKKLDEFKILPKTYVTTIKLGYVSDTFDKMGKITLPLKKGGIRGMLAKILPNPPLQKEGIELILNKFIGKQRQLPPMFSAKKINGKRLYKLARQGKTIKRKKNKIKIYDIKLLDYNPKTDNLKFIATVSSGTYIRTLAHDIGKKLNCGAYCEELRRTKIGKYDVKNAQDIKQLDFTSQI